MEFIDKFIFIPNHDQVGNDALFSNDTSLHTLIEIALNEPDIIAFNTLGYCKNDITNITFSEYLSGDGNGIYILKSAFFTFIPNYDQYGNDMIHLDLPLEKLMKYAILDNNCVAFNMNGFFKNKIDNLSYSKTYEGIYIKNKFLKTDFNIKKYTKDHFIFVPNKDQFLYDIESDSLSIYDKMEKSLKDNNIVAFNTVGYYKSNVPYLSETHYFDENDGIYIKNDYYLKHTIQRIYNFDNKIMNDVFIETGSFTGDGIQAAINLGFKEIHSIELAEKYYELCKEKFKNYQNVHLHLGDSGIYLEEILKNINTGVTFWLDGHYSTLDTACADNYVSPIQQELNIIKKYNHKNHVILIDDMDSFTDGMIEFNNNEYNKCGYINKNKLEETLKNIQGENNTQYYFGPACVSYQK